MEPEWCLKKYLKWSRNDLIDALSSIIVLTTKAFFHVEQRAKVCAFLTLARDRWRTATLSKVLYLLLLDR